MGKRSSRAVSGYREQSDPKYARVLVSFKRPLIDSGPYRPAKRSMSSRLLLPAPPVRPLLMPPPAWDVVPYEPIPEAVEDQLTFLLALLYLMCLLKPWKLKNLCQGRILVYAGVSEGFIQLAASNPFSVNPSRCTSVLARRQVCAGGSDGSSSSD